MTTKPTGRPVGRPRKVTTGADQIKRTMTIDSVFPHTLMRNGKPYAAAMTVEALNAIKDYAIARATEGWTVIPTRGR